MIVHVMPTYRCNLGCSYCYLKKENTQTLNLNTLESRLNEIRACYSIEQINVYGGEISLLSTQYLNELFKLCRKYCIDISAITNFTHPEILEQFPSIHWAVSVNDERPNNKEVLQRLLYMDNRNISISQVVTPSALKKGASAVLKEDAMLGGYVEFLRYSPSSENLLWDLTNADFENFMIDVMENKDKYPISIKNEQDIISCLNGTYNAYADSNVFIAPDGSFNYVAYGIKGEYFCQIPIIENIKEVRAEEEAAFPCVCKYRGRCYAEHLAQWKEGDSCCGCKRLLDYYEKNLYQNNRSMPA